MNAQDINKSNNVHQNQILRMYSFFLFHKKKIMKISHLSQLSNEYFNMLNNDKNFL